MLCLSGVCFWGSWCVIGHICSQQQRHYSHIPYIHTTISAHCHLWLSELSGCLPRLKSRFAHKQTQTVQGGNALKMLVLVSGDKIPLYAPYSCSTFIRTPLQTCTQIQQSSYSLILNKTAPKLADNASPILSLVRLIMTKCFCTARYA